MGQRIGLGPDTWPPDMIANMQLGLMVCRIVEADPLGYRSEDLFDAATLAGANALGRPDLGRLQPGAKADIAVIDQAQTLQTTDPIQTIMTGTSGRDVTSVLVDRRLVMLDRQITGFDETASARQAQAQFDRLIAHYPDRIAGHPPVADIFHISYPRSMRHG